MKTKLLDGTQCVHSGELAPTQYETVKEHKSYFYHYEGFKNPRVQFSDDYTLELKRTQKGYAATATKGRLKYGANLNAIRNRNGRFGLTVWTEVLK